MAEMNGSCVIISEHRNEGDLSKEAKRPNHVDTIRKGLR